jgi:hypothetical protein
LVSGRPSSLSVLSLSTSPKIVVVRVRVRHWESVAVLLHSCWAWSCPSTQRSVSFLKMRSTWKLRSTPTIETSSIEDLAEEIEVGDVDGHVAQQGRAVVASTWAT